MKKLLKYIGIIVGLIAGLFLLFLLVMTLIAYDPPVETTLFEKNDCTAFEKDTITILSWNIGYGGLSAELDFFYEGGTTVRPPRHLLDDNLKGIANHLQINNTADIIMIQEIDKEAARTYNVDEVSYFAAALPGYFCTFAVDYDVQFVPLPITKPMGRVKSGIANYSKHIPCKVVHYVFPFKDSWPTNIFMLRYGFTASYYKLANGKELVVMNTHNSAFDDGTKRANEMNFMRDVLLKEYNEGNYVIAGGDWNQIPPLPADKRAFESRNNDQHNYFVPRRIEENFMPEGWQWVSDGQPSNRFLYEPYVKGQTAETLLDFFLVSANIDIVEIETQQLNYNFADHNPIKIKFVLK